MTDNIMFPQLRWRVGITLLFVFVAGITLPRFIIFGEGVLVQTETCLSLCVWSSKY